MITTKKQKTDSPDVLCVRKYEVKSNLDEFNKLENYCVGSYVFCSLCQVLFDDKLSFDRHVRAHLDGLKRYVNRSDGAEFDDVDALKCHFVLFRPLNAQPHGGRGFVAGRVAMNPRYPPSQGEGRVRLTRTCKLCKKVLANIEGMLQHSKCKHRYRFRCTPMPRSMLQPQIQPELNLEVETYLLEEVITRATDLINEVWV